MQSTVLCSVPECDRRRFGKGLCNTHYVHARSGRNVSEMGLLGPYKVTRHKLLPFWEMVDAWGPSFCWVYTGHISKLGYGMYSNPPAGTSRLAHRIAYGLLVEEVPADMALDHLCKNRRCVNPDHLEIVTFAENSRRAPQRSRTHCPRGHEYTNENTYREPKNPSKRSCLICRRAGARASRLRKRETA